MTDFRITLNQTGTDEVTILALRAANDVLAMRKARACMGKGWFIVTIEG